MDKEQVGCVACGTVFSNAELIKGEEQGYPKCPHCAEEGTIINFQCAIDILNFQYHNCEITVDGLQEYNEEYNDLQDTCF